MADVSSATYAEAKSMWDSVPRRYSGNLPRCGYWDDDHMDAGRFREYLDTGYNQLFFWHISCATTKLIGTGGEQQYYYQYASEHPELPVTTIATGSPALAYNSSDGPSGHPHYQVNGSHIGSGNPVDDYSYLTKYRFQSGSTPLGYTLCPVNSGSYLSDRQYLVPLLSGNEAIWVDSMEYFWNHCSGLGKVIVDSLSSHGVTVTDIITDWEDVTPSWDWGWNFDQPGLTPPAGHLSNYYYERDDRFDQNALRHKDQRLYDTMFAIYIARLQKMEELIPSATGVNSANYDFRLEEAVDLDTTASTLLNAYGRPKMNLSVYPYYGSVGSWPSALGHPHPTWYRLLEAAAFAAACASRNIHLFDAWVCTSISDGKTTGDIYEASPVADPIDRADDPQAYGYTNFTTVAQMIAMCKGLMAMGSIKLLLYTYIINSSYFISSASHGRWSTLIAYDEMQRYHEFIKYGSNYVPPCSINQYQRGTYNNNWIACNFAPTCAYGKDYNGDAIDTDIFITCRTLGSDLMFYGASFDESEGFVAVRAPNGFKVAVPYSPYGSVTIA